VNLLLQYMHEWNATQSCTAPHGSHCSENPRDQIRWTKLVTSYVKCNIDASIFNDIIEFPSCVRNYNDCLLLSLHLHLGFINLKYR